MQAERRRDGTVLLELDATEARELEEIVSYINFVVDHDEAILDLSDQRVDEWWAFLFEARTGERADTMFKRMDEHIVACLRRQRH